MWQAGRVPRKIRIEHPGAICHVMSHGDWRGLGLIKAPHKGLMGPKGRKRQIQKPSVKDLFPDDVDRQGFLKTLAGACQKTGGQAQTDCPMRNHFHLVVETAPGNLVAGMRWLLDTYTLRKRELGRGGGGAWGASNCWRTCIGTLNRVVVGRPAEWNSAIRQIKNLRYERAVHGERGVPAADVEPPQRAAAGTAWGAIAAGERGRQEGIIAEGF
jgi:hypothetical protein